MTKADLKRFRKMRWKKEEIEFELDMCRSASIRATSLDGDGGRSSDSASQVEKLAERLVYIENKYTKFLDEWTRLYKDITQAFDTLSDAEQTIMGAYYIRGLTWQQVCDETGWSWTQVVHKLHSSAIQKITKVN